jgi:hypothetical protein
MRRASTQDEYGEVGWTEPRQASASGEPPDASSLMVTTPVVVKGDDVDCVAARGAQAIPGARGSSGAALTATGARDFRRMLRRKPASVPTAPRVLPSTFPPWLAGRTISGRRGRPTGATQAAERLAGDQRLPAEVAIVQAVKGEFGHLHMRCHGVPPSEVAGSHPSRRAPSRRRDRATTSNLPDGTGMSSRTLPPTGMRESTRSKHDERRGDPDARGRTQIAR